MRSSVRSFWRPETCWSSPTLDCRPWLRRTRTVSSEVTQVGAFVSIESLEREHIARVIARSPSLEAAARILDIDATTLQRKRKRYGLA